MMQSTQKSAGAHPVARFNESHPTQKIQGMSSKKVINSASKHISNKSISVKHAAIGGPGDRLESAY